MIGSEEVTGLWVFAHPVGKFVHMPTGLQDCVGSKGRAVHLEHILLQHKVFSPCVDDVRLQRTSWRSIVIEPLDAIIDLKGRSVEETAAK